MPAQRNPVAMVAYVLICPMVTMNANVRPPGPVAIAKRMLMNALHSQIFAIMAYAKMRRVPTNAIVHPALPAYAVIRMLMSV